MAHWYVELDICCEIYAYFKNINSSFGCVHNINQVSQVLPRYESQVQILSAWRIFRGYVFGHKLHSKLVLKQFHSISGVCCVVDPVCKYVCCCCCCCCVSVGFHEARALRRCPCSVGKMCECISVVCFSVSTASRVDRWICLHMLFTPQMQPSPTISRAWNWNVRSADKTSAFPSHLTDGPCTIETF